jgi:hypothetical protein
MEMSRGSLLLHYEGTGNVYVYCKVRGKMVKCRNYMWLLKHVSWIVCPIIVCDGNICSGVVIGVS